MARWRWRWRWGFTGQMDIQPNWAHERLSIIFGEVTGRGEGWQTTSLCYFLLSNLLPSRFCLAIQSHHSGHPRPPLKGWPLLLGPASETRYPRTWALISDIEWLGPLSPSLCSSNRKWRCLTASNKCPSMSTCFESWLYQMPCLFFAWASIFPPVKQKQFPPHNCGKN